MVHKGQMDIYKERLRDRYGYSNRSVKYLKSMNAWSQGTDRKTYHTSCIVSITFPKPEEPDNMKLQLNWDPPLSPSVRQFVSEAGGSIEEFNRSSYPQGRNVSIPLDGPDLLADLANLYKTGSHDFERPQHYKTVPIVVQILREYHRVLCG